MTLRQAERITGYRIERAPHFDRMMVFEAWDGQSIAAHGWGATERQALQRLVDSVLKMH